MVYRIALFWFILSVASCKKEETSKELYPVEVNDTALIFSNLNTDTVLLDFAVVRIAQAHTLSGGVSNDGFALTKGAVLIPDIPVVILKQQFIYKTLDTLRNEDALKNISYNIRDFSDTVTGTVTTYTKNF